MWHLEVCQGLGRFLSAVLNELPKIFVRETSVPPFPISGTEIFKCIINILREKVWKKKEKLDDNEMDEWSLSVNTTSDHFYFSCTNKRQVPISTAVAMSRQDLYHWTSCERLEHKQLYHSTTQKGKLVKKTQYCKQNWRWWKRNTLKLRKERS